MAYRNKRIGIGVADEVNRMSIRPVRGAITQNMTYRPQIGEIIHDTVTDDIVIVTKKGEVRFPYDDLVIRDDTDAVEFKLRWG